MAEIPVTLQQQIYQEILKNGEWTDPSGLLKVTGYVSESAGKLKPGPNGFDVWFPEIEEADIDVLKPSADKLGEYKGRKGINKLRRLFNEIRFALPGDLKYRLHADDYTKAAQYGKWVENDPLVTVADTASKPHRKAGKPGYTGPERVTYNVFDLEQPGDLVQIGNYKGSKRVVYLLPETTEGLEQAYKIDAAYQNITKTAGKKASWGLKPYFIDGNGDFYEMESGGPGYKGEGDDYGYRKKKLSTHRKASFNYAMRRREATPTLEYVTDWVRKTFTDIPEDQVTAFGEMYYAMNQGEIDAKTAQRVMSNISEHGDHSIALSKGGVNWYTNVANIPGEVNLRKGGTNTPDWYNKALGISSEVDEVLQGGLSSPVVNPKNLQTVAYNQRGLNLPPEQARALGIDTGVHYLNPDMPGSPEDIAQKIDLDRVAKNEAMFNNKYPGIGAASEASGGLKNALRKAGSILPFVGAGMDAWDVTQRYDEMMNNPNEGFADWLDKTQFAIASATVGTSFWAEPANFALGMSNLGIDAMRTIFEEDKREDFGDMLRGVGRGIGHIGRQLL